MKKIYFLFTFALLALVAGAQKTVTFDFTKAENIVGWGYTASAKGNGTNLGGGNIVQDGVTLTCTDGTTATRFWNKSEKYEFRVYKDAKMTITADSKINEVKIDGTSYAEDAGNTVDTEWVYTFNSTYKIKTITVTLAAGGVTPPAETVANPVFSLEEGRFETAQTLTITCAADAKINYQINEGAEVKDQTSPVTIELPLVEGALTDYTVKATAVKGTAMSATVTKVYTIGKVTGETFCPITGAEQLQNGNKVVLIYKNDTEAYVADKFDADHLTTVNLFENIVAGNFVNANNAAMVLTVDKAADSSIALKFADGSYLAASGKNLNKVAERFVWTVGMNGTVEDVDKSICCNISWNHNFRMYSPSAACPAVNIYKSATSEKICTAPVFSLKEGRYTAEQNLNITTDMPGATVVYAICATAEEVPAKWETFVNPIVLAVGQTYYVKAKVQKEGYKDSEIVTREYIIKEMQDNEAVMAKVLISEVAVENSWASGSDYATFTYNDATVGGIQFAVTGAGGKYHSGYQSWSCEASGSMTVTLPEGFVFHHMEFFANLNGLNDSQITVDSGELCAHNAKGDPYVWNPRSLTNTVTVTPGAGKLFFEGFNIYIATSTSGVENAVAEEANVFGVAGGVKVVANAETEVAVYTLAGQMVAQYHVAAGETMINLEKGFYVVRANEKAAKVIVK